VLLLDMERTEIRISTEPWPIKGAGNYKAEPWVKLHINTRKILERLSLIVA